MSNNDPSPGEPLAVFGGTFDPVHYGHLRCADEVRQKLGLKNLYLLPAGEPVHRPMPVATTAQRLQMLQLTSEEFPSLLIDDREIRRTGPSYMVDTLRELREEFPQKCLLLLVGQDAANHLNSWFDWVRLFELANIVIMTRPDTQQKYAPVLAEQIQNRMELDLRALHTSRTGKVFNLEVTAVDISATAVKQSLFRGRSPGPMLPEPVLDYINENHLYSAP